MPDPDKPFICYGESYAIAGGRLAMDAAIPKRALKDIFYTSKPGRIACDETKEEQPMDYTNVLAYLRERLSADELKEVGGMLGVEVDTTGMDRRRGAFRGASDGGRRAIKKAAPYDTANYPHRDRLKF